jgi:hypothetical protein
VLQEAMAHGVVPVCSEFIGIHSLGFLRTGETCFIHKGGDLVSAADHVQRLNSERALLSRMSLAAHEAIREFSVENVWHQWEAAIMGALRLCPSAAAPRDEGLPSIAVDKSRLGRLGVSPQLSDWLRRRLRRFPDFPDGWAEWPGTLAALPASTQVLMLNELGNLDGALRGMQRSERVDC